MEETTEAVALKIAQELVSRAFPFVETEDVLQMGGSSKSRQVPGAFWTHTDRANESTVKARLFEMADLIAEVKQRLMK